MERAFRCWMCGEESSVEGRRSWLTIALSILMFSWLSDVWYKYCPRCTARLHAMSLFVVVLFSILCMVGALIYLNTG
jgi:hypothetical protein